MTIVKYPADVLREVASPVERFDSFLQDLADTLKAECVESSGLAVAAPQIGVQQALFACPGDVPDEGVFVNPRIIASSNDQWMFKEGCLSIPDQWWYISRPNLVTMEYQTLDGDTSWWTADELMGRMIQHEVDHLNGVLLIDKITNRERKVFEQS